jgi:hypothetical protein
MAKLDGEHFGILTDHETARHQHFHAQRRHDHQNGQGTVPEIQGAQSLHCRAPYPKIPALSSGKSYWSDRATSR